MDPNRKMEVSRSMDKKFKGKEVKGYPFVTPNENAIIDDMQQENLQRPVRKGPLSIKPNPHSRLDTQQKFGFQSETLDQGNQDLIKCEKSSKDLGIQGENFIKKSNLKKVLHYHLRSCVNPDMLVKIGSNNIYCHRILLKSYTHFFDSLETTGDNCTINLPEEKVTLKAFETIYNWMLLGGEDSYKLLNRKNFLEVLMASQHLEVKDLQDMCQSILESEDLYSEGNAFYLYMDAYHFNNQEVMDLMLPRIKNFFLTLVSSKDFEYLPFDILCKLLQSNYICVHSELEVFMSGVRWLLFEWHERDHFAFEVMKNIRFGLMTPSQLVDIKRNPDSPEILQITRNPDIQQLIDDGMAFAIKVHCNDGDFDEVSLACSKLGLTPPTMRNWAGTDRKYKKYSEFLKDLEELCRDSKSHTISPDFPHLSKAK